MKLLWGGLRISDVCRCLDLWTAMGVRVCDQEIYGFIQGVVTDYGVDYGVFLHWF